MSNTKATTKTAAVRCEIREWLEDPLNWWEWKGESTHPTESPKTLSPICLGDSVALVNWADQNEDILIRSIEEFCQLADNIASRDESKHAIVMITSGTKDAINIYAPNGPQWSFRPFISIANQ